MSLFLHEIQVVIIAKKSLLLTHPRSPHPGLVHMTATHVVVNTATLVRSAPLRILFLLSYCCHSKRYYREIYMIVVWSVAMSPDPTILTSRSALNSCNYSVLPVSSLARAENPEVVLSTVSNPSNKLLGKRCRVIVTSTSPSRRCSQQSPEMQLNLVQLCLLWSLVTRRAVCQQFGGCLVCCRVQPLIVCN